MGEPKPRGRVLRPICWIVGLPVGMVILYCNKLEAYFSLVCGSFGFLILSLVSRGLAESASDEHTTGLTTC